MNLGDEGWGAFKQRIKVLSSTILTKIMSTGLLIHSSTLWITMGNFPCLYFRPAVFTVATRARC